MATQYIVLSTDFGSLNSNYQSFLCSYTGSLTSVSTGALTGPESGFDLGTFFTEPLNRFTYTTAFGNHTFQCFSLSSAGVLVKNGTTSYTSLAGNPVFDLQGKFLFLPRTTGVQPFTIDQTTGILTAGTVVGTASKGIILHPLGDYIVSVRQGNTQDTTIFESFSINHTTGALTIVSTLTLSSISPVSQGFVWNNNLTTLYYTGRNQSFTVGISAISINTSTGTLSNIGTVGSILGGYFQIITDSASRLLFAVPDTGISFSNVTIFSINASTGALTQLTDNNLTSVLWIQTNDTYLYVLGQVSSTVASLSVYSINYTTGALTLVNTHTFSITSVGVGKITLSPNGVFLLVDLDKITVWTINPTTGDVS